MKVAPLLIPRALVVIVIEGIPTGMDLSSALARVNPRNDPT